MTHDSQGGLRGDRGVPNGQDDGTRDTASPSSLQTLSAEMRHVIQTAAVVMGWEVVDVEKVRPWPDQLDASAARQEEAIRQLTAEREIAQQNALTILDMKQRSDERNSALEAEIRSLRETRQETKAQKKESGRPCGCDEGADWICEAHR